MTPAELRTYRTLRGLTQRELGQALGVHQRTVAKWELGERAISEVVARAVRALRRPLAPQ